MTRSSSQTVDLERDEVPIELPTLTQTLLDLKALDRRPWIGYLKGASPYLFISGLYLFWGTPSPAFAGGWFGFAVLIAMMEAVHHQAERNRLIRYAIEAIIAQQNEHRRLLERLSRSQVLPRDAD